MKIENFFGKVKLPKISTGSKNFFGNRVEILNRREIHHKPSTQAYSRALQRIKEIFQRVVHGKLRSDFQRVRGDRVAVNVGVV